jgi:hypothetical protein
MIRYSKEYWGILTLFAWYGSAFPRALPFSLLASAVAGLIYELMPDGLENIWRHPYLYQTFAFVVGFMIVFRCVLHQA